MNFGNDPFATVGEDERSTDEKQEEDEEEVAEEEESRRMKGRAIVGGEERGLSRVEISARRVTGARRRGPINRRALSQSRKTAKLHLPF